MCDARLTRLAAGSVGVKAILRQATNGVGRVDFHITILRATLDSRPVAMVTTDELERFAERTLRTLRSLSPPQRDRFVARILGARDARHVVHGDRARVRWGIAVVLVRGTTCSRPWFFSASNAASKLRSGSLSLPSAGSSETQG